MPDVDIVLNAVDKASKPINQVGDSVESLSDKAANASKGGLSALAGALGTGLKVAAGLGVAAIVGIGSAVAVAGVNFDNMKQQAQIAFTTMLGSGTKAKAFLDDLQSFAASTPFEFPELVSASQKLIAMGFAAEDVKPMLTAVGDAVAGLGGGGEMVGRVTTALGQMQAKGKVSAEEMMQLTEAGIPAWQMLADKIGVSVPEAMDMVSGSSKKAAADAGVAWQVMGDGVIQVLPKMQSVSSGVEASAINVGDAISAITEGMNKNFGGMMEKQSKTFGGLVSTIKDTFSQISGQVMEPFFELMTSGLAGIVEWTSSPQFTEGVAQLTRWLDMAAQAASAFFEGLTSGESVLSATNHAFAILLPPSVFQVWEQITAAATELFDLFAGRIDAMDAFRRYWDETWKFVNQVVGIAVDYVKTNLPVWQANLLEWATVAWQWIQDAAPKVLTALGGWLGGIVAWLGENYPKFVVTILGWATALYTWIGDAIPKAIDALSDFVRGLRDKGEGEGTNKFSAMAQGWAGTLWKWIQEDLIPQVGPAFMDFIRATLDYGASMLTSLGTLATELGLTLWQWIVDVTPLAVKKLGEWGRNLWGWIRDNAPEWGRKLGEWAEIAWQWIVEVTPIVLRKIGEWGGAIWGWVKDNAPAWKDKIGEWAGIAWKWITETAIPEAKKKLEEWGAALWEWVTTNAPIWREKLDEWAKAAWEWITKTAIPEAQKKLGEWGTMLTDWVAENAPIWGQNFMDAGIEMMVALRDGIDDGIATLQNWLRQQGFLGGILNDMIGVTGAGGDGYTVLHRKGEEIAIGVSDGMSSRITDLQKQGWRLGEAVQEGISTNLDMHSPSRVMWGYGQDITAGLQGGIRAGVNGLKSEMLYVAEQIKDGMARANAEMLASVQYLTDQMTAKLQAAHLKASQAAVDISGLVKQLGLDASKMPVAWGGTLQPGQGINGPIHTNPTSAPQAFAGAGDMLAAMNDWQKSLLSTKNPMNEYLATIKGMIANAPQDVQNSIDRWLQTWKSSGDPLNDFFESAKKAISSKISSGATTLGKEFTSLGQALGVIKDIVPPIKASVDLLGGLTLTQKDLDPQGTKNSSIIMDAVSSTLSNVKSLFTGSDIVSMLNAQSEPAQAALSDILTKVSDLMKNVGKSASLAKDSAAFKDVMGSFYTGFTNALWGAVGNVALKDEDLQGWLSGLTKQASSFINQSLATGLDAMKVKNPVPDFVAGIGDFLKGTLEGAGDVFGNFKYQEEKAYAAGNLKEYLASEAANTKTQLKSMYQGLQNSIADILGITASELNVTGADSKRLVDRIKELTSGTNAETNMEFIGNLLQTAADFRNLSNFGTGKTYYADVLPTDARLTGGQATTNNFNITLAPGANASDDLLSTFNLLNSMYGTAP